MQNYSMKYIQKGIKDSLIQSAITCSKLTTETLEQVFEICPKLRNFEHILHLGLVLLLLTLSR